jgi:hypothetical protein
MEYCVLFIRLHDLRQTFSNFRGEMRDGFREIGTRIVTSCKGLLEQYTARINTTNSPPAKRRLHSTLADEEEDNRSLPNDISVVESTNAAPPPLEPLNTEQQTMATAFFLTGKQNSKGISMATVFYEWYMREWHTFSFPVRSKERDIQVQIWKTVAHLKRFLPDNCTITAKPKHNNEELASWNKQKIQINRARVPASDPSIS